MAWPDPRSAARHGGRRLGDDLHMKGLTVLWMCLCCLRPEDVAKVLPQSGQACARAPTCWDRICRCRLLGSVNTWDTDAVGRCPSASPWPLAVMGLAGHSAPCLSLCCSGDPLGGPQSLFPQRQFPRGLWPRGGTR